jgi:Reverse transcriptase (RNA-dependent DNA polymerase)
MRRKPRVLDGTIHKWEARLNIDEGKQVFGLDFWDTYNPVSTWATIRLVIAIINQWELQQLDFVQAFPQAPIQTELYMDLPKGYLVNNSQYHYVIKLLRNVYGQKQAGRVWNEFLLDGLKEIGFVQSQHGM